MAARNNHSELVMGYDQLGEPLQAPRRPFDEADLGRSAPDGAHYLV